MSASIATLRFLSHAESHRMSELSGLAAADLIDDALNPIGRLEDGADLPSSKRPRTATPFESVAKNALSPGGNSRVAGGNRHPQRAHELKLLGGELNGRPDCAHRIDRNAHTLLGKRREHFLQRFGLPAAGADVQREAAASATSMRRRIMNGSFGVDGFWSPGSPK